METVIPIAIYIVIPVIGFVIFRYLNKKLKPTERKEEFTIKLLIAFACLGGMLLLLLTTIFWKWSGLATLGSVFLIIVAPIIMTAIAYDSYKRKADESEKKLFNISITYFIALPILLLIAFFLDK